jgi:hypothetical protein
MTVTRRNGNRDSVGYGVVTVMKTVMVTGGDGDGKGDDDGDGDGDGDSDGSGDGDDDDGDDSDSVCGFGTSKSPFQRLGVLKAGIFHPRW